MLLARVNGLKIDGAIRIHLGPMYKIHSNNEAK